jgi:nucleoid-associated protein YgaU
MCALPAHFSEKEKTMAERDASGKDNKKRTADSKSAAAPSEADIVEQLKASRGKMTARDLEYLGEHTVVSGDTLSHIALKFYGSAVRDKWMAIYEANKETIGDNPSLIRPGQVLKIPKLAD